MKWAWSVTRLRTRLDNLYADKLDGQISSKEHDRLSREWRTQQAGVNKRLMHHKAAYEGYIDEGIRLLRFATMNLQEEYDQQDTYGQRRLIDILFAECQ